MRKSSRSISEIGGVSEHFAEPERVALQRDTAALRWLSLANDEPEFLEYFAGFFRVEVF